MTTRDEPIIVSNLQILPSGEIGALERTRQPPSIRESLALLRVEPAFSEREQVPLHDTTGRRVDLLFDTDKHVAFGLLQ